MANRVINHLVEAKQSIASIRQNADEREHDIKAKRDRKTAQIKQDLDDTLKAFKREQKGQFEETLANEVENQKKR